MMKRRKKLLASSIPPNNPLPHYLISQHQRRPTPNHARLAYGKIQFGREGERAIQRSRVSGGGITIRWNLEPVHRLQCIFGKDV